MKIRLIFKQIAMSTIIVLASKQIRTTILIRVDKINLTTITRATIIKRHVKINFLFFIFIKIVFIRYNNNNNNVFIKKTIQIDLFIKYRLIAINHSKINIHFIDRRRNSSSLNKYRYKIETRQIFNCNRNFFDKIIIHQMNFVKNKIINKIINNQITIIKTLKINQKYIMTMTKKRITIRLSTRKKIIKKIIKTSQNIKM